ncbi:winged helix DNA-binding domain-containing protein [Arthrobacter cryoconiti]|uniref:Winged helix DNA-binding domain-containing protein n=1 Tax=Arthrobacter cryoconiti TaxID=748907 RepID=A0ABV8QXE9_9MICC|nr:winged helix DNA-binding domain-containing protein [Arthrobacter cryoconiti]MCC9067540.1 winged helix DNA-binding domain-containing protein [Arthrobacter cryoconiti]
MRHVPNTERRARLARRHALSPDAHVRTVEDATRAVVALHATDAPSVHLSVWARTIGVVPADVDRALYTDRTLVKQLAMRRTLFAFPKELLPAVLPSSAARVASSERARMSRDLVRAGIASDGGIWLDRAEIAVVAALTGGVPLSAAQLRRAAPLIDVTVQSTAGESWSAPQVLTLLGAEGANMRGPCTGSFPTARPLWTCTSSWLEDPIDSWTAKDGYRELVRRWLFAFGPGTEDDMVWWLGATKGIVRAALEDLGAVAVTLDQSAVGWLLPNDLEEVRDPEPWTALLPPLDPTVMGWKGRGFYLGSHHGSLFDSRGNAGTTAWVDGRIVGCWIQDQNATVRLGLLEEVSAAATRSLNDHAADLTEWLNGIRSPTGYQSSMMRALAADWSPKH